MAYNLGSPCVYNLPLALDPTLSYPAGFKPEFARHRCKDNVSNSIDCIIGPMPAMDFVDHFFNYRGGYDLPGKMSVDDAFKSVPYSADSVWQICKPLVSSFLFPSLLHLTFLR